MPSWNASPALSGLAVLLSALGCSSGTDEPSIGEQPLSGILAGQAWTVRTARAEPNPFAADGEYDFNLWSVAFDACATDAVIPTSDSVTIAVPRSPGSYTVESSSDTSTYPTWQPYPSGESAAKSTPMARVAYSAGLEVSSGRVVIRSTTDALIAGGAHVVFDSGESLDGTFAATICAR